MDEAGGNIVLGETSPLSMFDEGVGLAGECSVYRLAEPNLQIKALRPRHEVAKPCKTHLGSVWTIVRHLNQKKSVFMQIYLQ